MPSMGGIPPRVTRGPRRAFASVVGWTGPAGATKASYTYTTCLGLLLCAVSILPLAAQQTRPAANEPPARRGPRGGAKPPALPPLAMTCPMHPDVVEEKPGSCPLCKMALVPVRLESVWSCPIHQAVIEHAPGQCPIDKRDLVQMTMALTWTCKGRPDIDQIEPGRCPDGSATIAKRTLRPHGNHNPQHGGQFFMAPDTWHHLEGAYPQARVFRLYLYDDFARPLPLDQVKQVQARVVTNEKFDAATRKTTEVTWFPLVAAPGTAYLQARVDTAALPAQMTAKVRFKPGGDEYRFDFAFPSVTTDPNAKVAAAPAANGSRAKATAAARTAGRPASTTPAGSTVPPRPVTTPAAAAAKPAGDLPVLPDLSNGAIDPSLIQVPIPETVPEMLAQLTARKEQIGSLIDRGNFAAVFVPAFQARDVALALEERLTTLPSSSRERGAPAIQRLVRAAWMLDAFGDLGNKQQLSDAFTLFSSSVTEVATVFAQP
jgi:hypothetical protein